MSSKQSIKFTETFEFSIFIAGEKHKAEEILNQFCWDEGFCVHVIEAKFLYTGGREDGVKVGLVNYPFPKAYDSYQ